MRDKEVTREEELQWYDDDEKAAFLLLSEFDYTYNELLELVTESFRQRMLELLFPPEDENRVYS